MLPSFLITLREVLEASLIVATILGILYKLKHTHAVKTVWIATTAAGIVSVILLIGASFAGLKAQQVYSGKTEEFIEGILMVTSAVFITWAVFFLHTYFSTYKVQLLQKIKKTVEEQEQNGLFILVFTAVFREGFEIVLFLSTIYFSESPQSIFAGFVGGAGTGLLIAVLLFAATIRLPVYYAFRTTSVLLILFAAGLAVRGVHEFAELGLIPIVSPLTFDSIPAKTTIAGGLIKTVFGFTQTMDMIQIILYISYVSTMTWWVFLRPHKKSAIQA